MRKFVSFTRLLPRSFTPCRRFSILQPRKLGDEFKVDVGDLAIMTRRFTQEEVHAFGNLSGDMNPLHVDPEAAQKFRFKRTICHGILTGSLFSTLIGNHLPGSIYLSQSFKFMQPVFMEEEVEAKLEIMKIKRGIITFKTTLRKIQEDSIAIEGEAVVLLEALK
mmetsp:Transcript_32739/g.37122  ORF Transcript_32739/g.37122 Transcript_32739/m.37122 type:complete len:164 (+) Transcript_32739:64-555(+)